MLKPLTVWTTTNYEKFLKKWEYQTTLPASWETRMEVKKQQLETDMEKWTGSKLGKECVKTVYCHPAYLTYMQSTSCEMPGWMKHRLESRLLGEISITSDTQMTPPLCQKAIIWDSAFSSVYLSFSPLPFVSLLFSAICRPPQTTTLPSCIYFPVDGFGHCLLTVL